MGTTGALAPSTMSFGRIASSLFFFVALSAAACSTGNDEPADLSDPGYLPTGTYTLQVAAASCNVNSAFQPGGHVALFRNAATTTPAVNIPLPLKVVGDTGSLLGTPRQDLDLTKRHIDFTRERDGCGVTTSIDVTQLSSDRLGILYREIPEGACEIAECSVDYTFDLVEAACARECNAKEASLSVDGSGSMIWRCECQ